MQLLSWLSAGMTCRPQTRRAPARKPIRVFRPRVEVLEGRDLPSTLTVTTNLDSGVGSLRDDIAAAHARDTIVFASSLNGQTITLATQLEVPKNLTIQGPGASQLTISGQGAARVFQVDANMTVALSGLTISGGGGWADPNAFDRAPYDGDGGGILNFGTLTVTGCTLSGNSATIGGGGIYNYLGGTLTVSGCTLSGNSAFLYGGGGIYNLGTLTVSSSTLTGNTANDSGGIFNDHKANATIISSVVLGNSAASGADLYKLGPVKISKDSTVGVIGP